MLKRSALALIGVCLLAASAAAQGKPTKPEDCAKLEVAKRSECARALGQTGDNVRSNKSGETRAGERAGAVKELNKSEKPKGSTPAKGKEGKS